MLTQLYIRRMPQLPSVHAKFDRASGRDVLEVA